MVSEKVRQSEGTGVLHLQGTPIICGHQMTFVYGNFEGNGVRNPESCI